MADKGASYIGTVDHSRSHTLCEPWTNYEISQYTFPDGSAEEAENYCRYTNGHFFLQRSFDTLRNSLNCENCLIWVCNEDSVSAISQWTSLFVSTCVLSALRLDHARRSTYCIRRNNILKEMSHGTKCNPFVDNRLI